VKRDTQGRCPAAPRGRNILAMDTNLHSHLIALHVQSRMQEAIAARTARAARQDRPREPRLLALKRRVHRRVAAEAPIDLPGASASA
jgi:hypothetical protein